MMLDLKTVAFGIQILIPYLPVFLAISVEHIHLRISSAKVRSTVLRLL